MDEVVGGLMDWKMMLAQIADPVDEELLPGNEYLAAENRILGARIKGRLRLTAGERRTLAEIGKKLGRQVLAEVSGVVKPQTILACQVVFFMQVATRRVHVAGVTPCPNER